MPTRRVRVVVAVVIPIITVIAAAATAAAAAIAVTIAILIAIIRQAAHTFPSFTLRYVFARLIYPTPPRPQV